MSCHATDLCKIFFCVLMHVVVLIAKDQSISFSDIAGVHLHPTTTVWMHS